MKLLPDKNFFAFLKKGGLWKAAIIFVLGIILISFSAAGTDSDAEGLQHDEELRLTELCRRVRGVGDCYVMVGYKESQSRYSDSERRVESVTVLCDGADSPSVRSALVELVTSLYGIGSNRVTILRCK